jgi:hypothetical protein
MAMTLEIAKGYILASGTNRIYELFTIALIQTNIVSKAVLMVTTVELVHKKNREIV